MGKNRFSALALVGVLSALTVALLLLTVTPIATIGTVALAAICGIPVVVELGRKAGVLHFVAVAILAWLIVPGIEGKVLYTAFFGWYTTVKAWLEQKIQRRSVEQGVKIALFWGLLAIGGTAWYFLIPPTVIGQIRWWMIPVGVVVSTALFVVYDRCLTGLVGLYMRRLHPTVTRLFPLQ